MPVISNKGITRDCAFIDLFSVHKGQLADGVVPAPYFAWKGVIDRAAAAILLIPGLPIIALLMLLVRLTSRGPGIYRQVRVGKDGEGYVMYKLRTMRHDAEARTGPVWTQPKDSRITRVGKMLRKLHLDELPQLFNVLKGEMSLIGPRPERPEFVPLLAEQVPGYLNRLAVLPGVTGLAQINLPPDSDLDSVRRKVVLDLEYVKHAGLLLDIRMFFCTFIRLLGLPGAVAMNVMGLHREVSGLSSYVPVFDGNASRIPKFSVIPAGVASRIAAVQVGGDDKASKNGEVPARSRPEAAINRRPH